MHIYVHMAAVKNDALLTVCVCRRQVKTWTQVTVEPAWTSIMVPATHDRLVVSDETFLYSPPAAD